MRNTDLNVFRALIRSRHGLPPPPGRVTCILQPRPEPATQAERSLLGDAPPAAARMPARPILQPRLSPATSAIVQSGLDASRPTPASPAPTEGLDGCAPAEAMADWSPDDVLHRLVELLMEMRGLAAVEAAGAERIRTPAAA